MDTTVDGRSATLYQAPGVKSPHPKGELRELYRACDRARLGACHRSARSILGALWSYSNRTGGCYPSQDTLARLTGYSVRTVRTGVKALERAGIIIRDVPSLRERRRARRSTAYVLLIGAARAARRAAAGTRPELPAEQSRARDLDAEAPPAMPETSSPLDARLEPVEPAASGRPMEAETVVEIATQAPAPAVPAPLPPAVVVVAVPRHQDTPRTAPERRPLAPAPSGTLAARDAPRAPERAAVARAPFHVTPGPLARPSPPETPPRIDTPAEREARERDARLAATIARVRARFGPSRGR